VQRSARLVVKEAATRLVDATVLLAFMGRCVTFVCIETLHLLSY
jgi:hypothetical protein